MTHVCHNTPSDPICIIGGFGGGDDSAFNALTKCEETLAVFVALSSPFMESPLTWEV